MNEPLLLVTAGGRRLAFRMSDVLEVQERGEVHRVPAGTEALRGVTLVRGRLAPLVHLGALLASGPCPDETCATIVVAVTAAGPVGFEVDAADALPPAEVLPPMEQAALRWVSGVVRREDGWVPVVNLEALAERLRPNEVTHA
jgi:chemotaxis signal transduction protein